MKAARTMLEDGTSVRLEQDGGLTAKNTITGEVWWALTPEATRKLARFLSSQRADRERPSAPEGGEAKPCDCCNGMVLRGAGGKPVPCPDCGSTLGIEAERGP